jgi:hypothetical protein
MGPSKWIGAQWDRVLAVVGAVIAGLVLMIGWFRVSDTPYPAEQLPGIFSGGIGGIFLLGIAATLWLSADLRDEWCKLDSIDESLKELIAQPTGVPSACIGSGGDGQSPAEPPVVRPVLDVTTTPKHADSRPGSVQARR